MKPDKPQSVDDIFNQLHHGQGRGIKKEMYEAVAKANLRVLMESCLPEKLDTKQEFLRSKMQVVRNEAYNRAIEQMEAEIKGE